MVKMQKKLTLLYAEDEIQIRKNHIFYLQDRYDFNFLEADDGEEALALYKEYQPEIVLTDITMPKMNGLDLVSEIRKLSPHTKVIVLTAHAEQEKLLKAFELYVVNYLIKPVDRRKLSAAIDLAIETLPDVEEADNKIVHFNTQMTYDLERSLLLDDGIPIKLTMAEEKLLELLLNNSHSNLSSETIFTHVWEGKDESFSTSSVRTLVKNLRKKIAVESIENSYGGYYRVMTINS